MLGNSRLLLIFLALLAVCWVPTPAASGLKKDGRLDFVAVRSAFHESDFDQVRAVLEGYLKKNPNTATREERIFAYKYLGVVYAADSLSQTRAASFFNMALELSPNLELVDMFAPPKIQNLFDSVKLERLKKAEYNRRFDPLGNPIVARPDTLEPSRTEGGKHPRPELNRRRSRAWLWWTMGAAAVVGAGTSYYVLSSPQEKRAPREVDPE